MDKVKQYKKIVRALVEEIVALSPDEEDGVENQLITDDEHGHYLYFGVGWENNSQNWFYATFVHVDVKPNGQVWLQHDGTDLKVGETLVKRGVMGQDMVIGFQPPFARPPLVQSVT
jgi:XisI protein